MSKRSEAVKRCRQKTKSKMVEAMGGKCQCCGYNKCDRALAFHHLDPSIKETGFGMIRANPVSWEKIVVELKKCILVCHNCHSEIHSGIRDIPATYSTFADNLVEYKLEIEEQDSCPVCNNSKPVTFKFCSHTCAATNRRKVDWDKIDLLALMKLHTITELEDMLGISNSAIYKRRDKILKNIPRSYSW